MGRPKQPLYKRDGIYYARVESHRWSTETSDPSEASRRQHFMKIKNKPWKEIKTYYGSRVEIVIDNTGQTFSRLIQHFSDPVKSLDLLKSVSPVDNYNVDEEPSKDCKNIVTLLDYEYLLKVKSNKPQRTLDYYRQRYDAMKRYVAKLDLNLYTFTKMKALGYPKFRLCETVRNKGELGFNNAIAGFPTVNKEIKHFRHLWSMWKDENRVSENPWVRVECIKPEGDDDEIEDQQPYTIDELKLILKNVDNKVIHFVLIFQAMLGLRPGIETLGISKTMIKNKKIWNAKKRRWDNFTYSPEAVKFFTDNIEGKTKGLTAKAVLKAFKEACLKAGLRVGTPYDLRHSYATESLVTHKIETVSKMLRHKDIKTTQVYAKTRPTETSVAHNEMQKKILEVLNSD